MKHLITSILLSSLALAAFAQETMDDINFEHVASLATVTAVENVQPRTISDYNMGKYGKATFGGNEDRVACYYTKEMLQPFIGTKITAIRALITDLTKIKSLFLRNGSSIYRAEDVLIESPVTQSVGALWYEVRLSKAINITGDIEGLAVGYDLEKGGPVQIGIGMNGVNSFKGNLYTYSADKGAWSNRSFGKNYTLPIQLIVEGEGGQSISELTVSHIETPIFTEMGQSLDLSFWVSNTSSTKISNYELEVLVDKEYLQTFSFDQGLSAGMTNKKFNLEQLLPKVSLAGKHQLSLRITKVNGQEVNSSLGAINSHPLLVYNEVVERQQTLVEEFTSEQCANCFRGIQNIKQLKQRQPDMVLVAVHLDELQYPDQVAAPESQFIKQMANVTALPSFACNRMAFILDNKESVANPNIAQLSDGASRAIDNFYTFSKRDKAVFATLSIENSYDAATHNLKVNVQGAGVKHAQDFLSDYALYVLVKEDNVAGQQGDERGFLVDTQHQDVLRGYISPVTGDNDLSWSGDNFCKVYNYTLKEDWKAEDMSVVAFLAPKFGELGVHLEGLAIQNCVSAPVIRTPNGISSLKFDKTITEVARYNLQGQRIMTPQAGINIVRYADGTTVKEIR